MGKPTGFLEFPRKTVPYRDPVDRLDDFLEIYSAPSDDHLRSQGARCMDCGVPFCQSATGCPIDNLIPEWNDLVYRGRWRDAIDRLHKTNNFPEFTGRVCPAPCEGSCVAGVNDDPITIKNLEQAIVDRAFAEGWVKASPPARRTGKRVAIIGSGPAGLAAADQLNKVGHAVTVFERADRVGGLLMYGIPNMKLDKGVVRRRLDLLRDEGIEFRTRSDVGVNVDPDGIVAEHDAVLLATGATQPRDLAVPGRELDGIRFAMEFLTGNTRRLLDGGPDRARLDGDGIPSARDRDVIVIGGGDTGTDCLATSLRQGCRSVVNFELLSKPPSLRSDDNPWPQWPRILRVDYGHAEVTERFGDDPRVYRLLTKAFLDDGNGRVAGVRTIEVEWAREGGRMIPRELPGTEREWKADLVLLALGFLGPERYVADRLQLECDERSNYRAAPGRHATNVPRVFAAGDCRRGQSLVVWAIQEGRSAARAIDEFLMGCSALPAPASA
ncbi:MAG: glutamate synthase subunit beta [Planctomycetes bacterium]|nr:glutamate synthase subunit beta [Planctomycetota bacterium]